MMAVRTRKPRKVVPDHRHEQVARTMARLIPKAVDPEAVPGKVWGSLTSPEVAGALAGLPSAVVYLLRARYHQDENATETVRLWAQAATIRISHLDGWGTVNYGRKMTIADIVMGDLLPIRCDVCKGRGHVPNERGIPSPCPACQSVGCFLLDGEAKAEMLGVKLQTWKNRWAPRAASVLSYLQHTESEATAHMTGDCAKDCKYCRQVLDRG